jgi:hypothetical protein
MLLLASCKRRHVGSDESARPGMIAKLGIHTKLGLSRWLVPVDNDVSTNQDNESSTGLSL